MRLCLKDRETLAGESEEENNILQTDGTASLYQWITRLRFLAAVVGSTATSVYLQLVCGRLFVPFRVHMCNGTFSLMYPVKEQNLNIFNFICRFNKMNGNNHFCKYLKLIRFLHEIRNKSKNVVSKNWFLAILLDVSFVYLATRKRCLVQSRTSEAVDVSSNSVFESFSDLFIFNLKGMLSLWIRN